LAIATGANRQDELRADSVADCKEKHEKDSGFEGLRDGDTELSDENAGQQGGGDRSQAYSFERKFAKIVPDGERKKDRDLRVLPKGCSKPSKYEHRLAPCFGLVSL
jgi:hypothetical protein